MEALSPWLLVFSPKSISGELGTHHYCLVSQVEEVRDAMENEMRTQLRRQTAAHTDHLQDVLRVQEQELKQEFEQVRIPLGPFPLAIHSDLSFTHLYMCIF